MDKPVFHKEFRKHAELGMTLIEMLIGAILMALLAYLTSTLFMNFNDANRSANAKSTAHESFRILNMRFDNQIQNRMPFELAAEEFGINKSVYEKKVFNNGVTKLKSHSIVIRNAPPYTRSYDRFVMSVECVPFSDWRSEYNTFIRNNTSCGTSLPICGSNSRPVIRYSQRLGLNKSQVTGSPISFNHSNNFREFPAAAMPLYQTAAAATFCVNTKGSNPDDDLIIHYYFFYFRAGKVLSWLETVSHLGKEVNHRAGVFPKADR